VKCDDVALAFLMRSFRSIDIGKARCIKQSPCILRSTLTKCKRCVTDAVFSLDLTELFRRAPLRLTEPCIWLNISVSFTS
jgi:hypothetical protein